MEQEPDYLDIMREELYAEYEQTFLPKVASAKRRKKTMGRFGRDLAVQTLATIIGGVALGGGAVAIGLDWLRSMARRFGSLARAFFAHLHLDVLPTTVYREGSRADAEAASCR